jgi:prepilin-type N-terminal cleavage/methylation domain-containing protein
MKFTNKTFINHRGFTLIELIAVILIIAVLGTIAVQKLAPMGRTVKIEETRQEMKRLSRAIVGNPDLYNVGVRSDFGYVGDVGSLPPNLDALYTNPGYATWKGPYIENAFAQSPDDFKKDAWQSDYIYSGIAISSIGSGETLKAQLAGSANQILRNQVTGNIYDRDGTPPGTDYYDSVTVRLDIPDGVGGMTSKIRNVDAGGFFLFDSIPIGNHELEIIYHPGDDTLRRFVSVPPNSHLYGEYYFPRDIWWAGGTGGSGGIEFVANSDTLTMTNCFKLKFWITNASTDPITVSGLTLTWPSPTAYYNIVRWNGVNIRSGNPGLGSGDQAIFSASQIIDPGGSALIQIESFGQSPNGGSPVDMTGAVMSVDFSDGSTITFMADLCIG